MKILWAYDPFQKNKKLNLLGKKILNSLTDKKDSVTAVYVASKSETELTTAFNIPEDERFTLYPKKIILGQLLKIKEPLIKAHVISSLKLSLSSAIQLLSKYSSAQKIDLILISTNSKTLLPRLVFGSFAETLIHASECDLLMYHQKTKFGLKSTRKIAYAHDFSTKGDLGLKRVLEYAKKWNASVVVINVPMFLSNMTYEKFKELNIKRSLEIEEFIKTKNVPYEMVISYEVKPIDEIILGVAYKKNADLIAVSAKASKLTALLGGSITRQVIRETKIPALILKV